MKWHVDALKQVQSEVVRCLGPFLTREKMYLAGGAALGLHLGHRFTHDLDWFTRRPLGQADKLIERIRDFAPTFRSTSHDEGTLYGSWRRVKMSMITYKYPLVEKPIACSTLGCELASLADLAAMKLMAIAQRGRKRDFVDLYFLGTEIAPLSQMLRWYDEKYNADPGHLLVALSYFEDAEPDEMPDMVRKVRWDAVKRTIRGWANDARRGA